MEINEELARKCLRNTDWSISMFDRQILAITGDISISDMGKLRGLILEQAIQAIENHCAMEAKIIPSQVEKT